MTAYVLDIKRRHKPGGVERYARCLTLFARFLDADDKPNAEITILSKPLLRRFWEWLSDPVTSLHGKSARSESTKVKITDVVHSFWQWCFDNDEQNIVPAFRRLEVFRPAAPRAIAPTWEEMDLCIAACRGWRQRAAIVERFTGLRVWQVLRLEWSDVDMERGTLHVRPELGKSIQEMAGRFIPLSPHLVKIMAGWGVREGFVIALPEDTDRSRVARSGPMAEAWARAGVREAVWKKRPNHAFRKGFISNLKRDGADDEAVEWLVGHAPLGERGAYADPTYFPLVEAANLVPPLSQPQLIDSIKESA